jgi:hypothetical protein
MLMIASWLCLSDAVFVLCQLDTGIQTTPNAVSTEGSAPVSPW